MYAILTRHGDPAETLKLDALLIGPESDEDQKARLERERDEMNRRSMQLLAGGGAHGFVGPKRTR